jgi:O-antigen ligase
MTPFRLALAAVPAWFTAAVLIFAAPSPMKVLVGGVLILSAVSPVHGLLATAVAAPLGNLIGTVLGLQRFRLTEAIVLAFLTGWLVRGPDDRRGPEAPSRIGWLLAAAVVMSVIGQAIELGRYPDQLTDTFGTLFYGYYLLRDRIGFGDGARIIEGLALTSVVVALFRRHPAVSVRLPAALAISASVAAVASLLLWKGIAPAAILERHALIGYRVSAHVADVNAAGSYYALSVCLALGMAARGSRRARALWLAAAAAAALGIWLSDSRSAFGAVAIVIAAAAAWFATASWTVRSKAVAVAVVVALGLTAGLLRVRQLSADPEYRGASFREQFNATSVRMIEARPWTGVGVGQYFAVSPLFLGPSLAFSYGAENAHNYFLQLAAELGLGGLVLFLLWTGSGILRTLRALAIAPRDARLLGLLAGVGALLGTSATGHPLLVDEVATPFWMQFGLMIGLAGSVTLAGAASERRPPRWQAAAAVAALLAIAVVQVVARPELRPVESQNVDGLFGWETGADGARFRWSGGYASVFVPADVTRVYIPVRMPAVPGLSPMGIEVKTTASPGERMLIGDRWATLNLDLPDAVPPTRYKRINLKIDRTWKPAVYVAGSADLRAVGVQVGEIRTFREH